MTVDEALALLKPPRTWDEASSGEKMTACIEVIYRDWCQENNLRPQLATGFISVLADPDLRQKAINLWKKEEENRR